MILKKSTVKAIGYSILAISLFVSLNIAFKRHLVESNAKTVDLAIAYTDIEKLAAFGSIERSKLLSRLSQEVGLSSIVIDEETLESLIDQGRISVLKGSEINNMLRIGRAYRTALTHLAKKTKIKPNHFYLIIDELRLYERIKNYLVLGLPTGSVKERGWNTLEVTADKDFLMEMGFGISPSRIKDVQRHGFSVISRYKDHLGTTEALLKLKFNEKDLRSVHTIMFYGETILGYPQQLETLTELFKGNNLSYGQEEFYKIRGDRALGDRLATQLVRVHNISSEELSKLGMDLSLTRYLRAVKERGVRTVIVKPFYIFPNNKDVISYNFAFFSTLKKQLKQFGYSINPSNKHLSRSDGAIVLWESVLLSLGVFVAFIVLIYYFYPMKEISVVFLFSTLIAALMVVYSSFGIEIWNRVMSLLVSIIFPVLAVISFFPEKSSSQEMGRSQLIKAHFYLLKLFGVGLLAALFIIGFNSDIHYLMGVRLFFGVKIAFIVPILLTAIYFYVQPHRLKVVYYIFKRLFFSNMSLSLFLAILISGIVIAVYILRSGNYLQIPFLEHWMRNTLEYLFFVRPRTKEFLIGYPLLLIAYLYVDRRILRQWLWFFNGLGIVALVSLINSFCHSYTPIFISFYRSILGLILGVVLAWAYIVALTLSKRLVKKISGS